MKEHIQAVVTILALVNPIICAEIFSDYVANIPRQGKVKEAIKVVTTVGIILLIAAITGTPILKAFGVSIDAFSCAGGGILVWIGVGMLRSAQDKPKTGSTESMAAPFSKPPASVFIHAPHYGSKSKGFLPNSLLILGSRYGVPLSMGIMVGSYSRILISLSMIR